MAMHPLIMQQKVGRLVPKGTSLDYPENAKVMPDLPPKAREAHDWIHEEIKNADILGLKNRTPRRWNIAGPQQFVHHTRDEGHFRLNNLCTLPHLHMKPELRRLECWWLPKLPKIVHPTFYHPPVPRIRRVHTIWSRPQMWADEDYHVRWQVSAQYDTFSEVEARIWEWIRRWDLEELKKLQTWEYQKTKPASSLDTSEFEGTSNEPSEGSVIYDHGMNDPDEDWWGT